MADNNQVEDPREYTPRLLKEIPFEVENQIYETLQELRILFPSYRDDQLFVFWLGKLSQAKIDVHDFDSSVSFNHRLAGDLGSNKRRALHHKQSRIRHSNSATDW